VITCEGCAFKRIPNMGYGKEAGVLEWVFDSIRVTQTLGL